MAEKKPSSREQVKQIIKQIESGIQELFQSEKYAEYLRTMSRFHTYSYRNQILIHMQMPHASRVAGFNKWKNQFNRHVKKGEKGLTVIAPTPFKKRIEETKLDPDTGAPMTDKDGEVIVEEKVVEIPLFRPVKVFDVSQTEGAPLPSLAADLTGNVEHYEAFMEALRRASPVPITIKALPENLDGVFSSTNQDIAIREGMSQIQTVCAGVHEITHAILHNRNREQLAAAAGDETKEPPKPKDRRTEEVEAESVSYAVCQYFGIETGANSLGYIATWSRNKTLSELKASMETISKTANILITNIERHFQEICKECGIELSEAVAVPATDTPERFISDLFDLMDGLYQEGLISENFPKEGREQTKANLIHAIDQEPSAIRKVLEQFVSEGKSAESAKALLDRLDALTDQPSQAKQECIYKMEVNAGATGDHNTHFIQAYEKVEGGLYNPEEILFVGSAAQCHQLLEGLKDGTIQRGSFSPVRLAAISRYATQDRAELDAFVGLDDKVYLGRRDHYDGHGHYFNQDNSLLYISDNYEIFKLISGFDFPFSQSELVEDEVFTQKDYDEFAALQTDLLAQFVETAPVYFNGEPFSQFPPGPDLEPSDRIAQEETAHDTTLDEYPMPDPELSVSDLEQRYGYQGGDLLPVTHERAAALFDRDFTVYAIVNGGGAEIILDQDDIEAQPLDNIFAVPREEWEVSPDFRRAVAERMDRQEAREQAFLGHAGDCFAIYQLRHDVDQRLRLRFEPLETIQKAGFSPIKDNYELVYTSEMPSEQGLSVLDSLYEKFNINHPPDYQHPSLSVSDIVALKQDGVVSCYYVDRFGFTALPDFIQNQPQKSVEAAVGESDLRPTVADLEAQVKAKRYSGRSKSPSNGMSARKVRKGAPNMENKLTYKQVGDYLLPDLTLPEQPDRDLGKYGRMRQSYLEEHRPGLFNRLTLKGTLFQHCMEIEDTANSRLERMMPELAKVTITKICFSTRKCGMWRVFPPSPDDHQGKARAGSGTV